MKNKKILGAGDFYSANVASPDAQSRLPDYAYRVYSEAKKNYERAERMRNVALVSDFASGLLNIIARRRGARYSLPTNATAGLNAAFSQARENMNSATDYYKKALKENPDCNGLITRKTLFDTLPKTAPVSPIVTREKYKKIPKSSWTNLLEKWRQENLQNPKWKGNPIKN